MEEKETTMKIIVLGPSSSWKSSLLNEIANNENLFPVGNNVSSNNFIMKKYYIQGEQYDLYDTMGIMPISPIPNLKQHLTTFKTTVLTEAFNLVLITFPLQNIQRGYDAINKIFATFSFDYTQNIFIIVTQGDLMESNQQAEEEFSDIQEKIKKDVKENKYSFDYRNVLLFNSEYKDEVIKKILLTSRDKGRNVSHISINDQTDYDDNMLAKLYKCDNVNKEEEEQGTNGGFFEWIRDFLNKCSFFNSPNMVL